MKKKPSIHGTTTVDIHTRPQITPDIPHLSPGQPIRVEFNLPTTPRPRPLPETDRISVAPDPGMMAETPRVTVSELPTSPARAPATPADRLERYQFPATAVLPAADAQGLRTLKGRQFVDLWNGDIAQVAIDPQTGLHRAKLQSELVASGPVLARDPDNGLWHPRSDLESIIFPLSDSRLEAFRTPLDFADVEPDSAGLFHHDGKRYVVIRNYAYQTLHDRDASSPNLAVMRIVRPVDPVAGDEANVYVATRPGRSEPIVRDPEDGWVGVNLNGAGGMRRGEQERPARQSLADRFAALVNRPSRPESRVRKLFPGFDDHRVAAWIASSGDDVGGALSLKEAEYKTLKKDLLNWAQAQNQTAARSQEETRQVTSLIRRCWRQETEARLRLPAGGATLPALTADFSHVRVLELESVKWSDTADTFLSAFTGLEHLILPRCAVEKLPASLARMTKLKTLDLSSNTLRLDPVSASQLEKLGSLESLILAKNPLGRLPDFSNFSQLTTLDLRHTGITEWPTGLLAHKAWVKLDVSNNQLKEVPQAYLNPTQERLAAVVQINSVTRLADNDFPSDYSIQLDDYWRRIRAVHPEWLNSAQPQGFDLQGSAAQRYRQLYPGKSISECRHYIYGFDHPTAQTRLASLEQEFNGLKNQLDAWVFSGGGVHSSYVRANQIELNALNRDDRAVARDRILACWRCETPQKLANDLTPIGLELDLSGLSLPSLPDIDADFSHVGSLKLSHMNLSTSPEGFLTRFRHVRWLDLSHNQLRELPPATGEMSAMTRLALHNNRIVLTAESARVLSERTTLRALSLYQNPQLRITPDFSRMVDMRSLHMADAGIENFPTGLGDQPLLDTVDLSNNLISHIPDAVIAPEDARLLQTARVNSVTRLYNNPLSDDTRRRLTLYEERLLAAGTTLSGANNLLTTSSLSQFPSRDALWVNVNLNNRDQNQASGSTRADSMNRWTVGLSADEMANRARQWQLLRAQQGSDGLFNTLERLLPDAIGRQDLQRRVWKVIDSITENSPQSEALRRELFDRAGSATCCDRAAFTFANLETRTMAYNARALARDQAQGPQLATLSRGLFRLHEVDKIASADIARREETIRNSRGAQGAGAHEHLVSEEVEIRLAYRHGLKDRLQLPGQPDRTAFTQLVNVSQADLDVAYTHVKALDNSPLEFEALMSREFWHDFITHKYRARFEEQRQPFQDQQATLDDAHADKTLVLAEYETQSKALQTALAIKEAALTETLTRQELSEHSALNRGKKDAAANR
ncbi:NEL-type E3 ubiquitin ligase domain-containing protein [Pseudomonas sp. PB106]|uniref:NEL-type E3 ubiquitin ligase domain-containing protein n=1 Tax=Pseudomonas sp. PB106 TaxID=2494699 RepID=UPI0021158B1A|nr:NEL-type E3 ubiquitin ligase domain-containing protein [Pseudomonas sp. PB106]